MSKSIRIRDHLYEEIARRAEEEHRPLVSQLEMLLEQALRMNAHVKVDPSLPPGHMVAKGGIAPRPVLPQISDPHFKPDPKGGRR